MRASDRRASPVSRRVLGLAAALALATSSIGGAVVVRGTDRPDVLRGTGGADTLDGRGGGDRLIGLGGPDRLLGRPGGDLLLGGPGRDRLIGGAGGDGLEGGAGDDRLDGGRGDDRLRGGRGRDVIVGRGGEDRLRDARGDDVLSAGGGRDRLVGGLGDDRLDGGADGDRLDGGGGGDRLRGGRGADALLGRGGDDTIQAGEGPYSAWQDTVTCGSGADTVLADYADRVAEDCERVRVTPRPWRSPTPGERAGIVTTLSAEFGESWACFAYDEFRVAAADPRYALWSSFPDALAYRADNGCLVGNGYVILERQDDGSWTRLLDGSWTDAPCARIGTRVARGLTGGLPCAPAS